MAEPFRLGHSGSPKRGTTACALTCSAWKDLPLRPYRPCARFARARCTKLLAATGRGVPGIDPRRGHPTSPPAVMALASVFVATSMGNTRVPRGTWPSAVNLRRLPHAGAKPFLVPESGAELQSEARPGRARGPDSRLGRLAWRVQPPGTAGHSVAVTLLDAKQVQFPTGKGAHHGGIARHGRRHAEIVTRGEVRPAQTADL